MGKTFEGNPCRKCGSTTRTIGGSKQCVACKDAARKRSKIKNKEASYNYWGQAYGLKKGEAEALLLNQNNACKICEKTDVKRWHIDHCHTSNVVRGILCHHCNVLLGMAGENINTLEKAIIYLRKNPL